MSAKGEFFKAKIRTAALNSVRDGVEVSAIRLQTNIKKILNQKDSGKEVRTRVRNTSKGAAGSTYTVWTSGAPAGQPPYKFTGELGRRIDVDLSRIDTAKPSARVGTNLVYARPLEYGSRRNAPHPFMRPTLVNSKTELAELFQKKVFASFRRYMR